MQRSIRHIDKAFLLFIAVNWLNYKVWDKYKPVCFLWCIFKTCLWAKNKEHISHLYGFSPQTFCFKIYFPENKRFLQQPVWDRMCIVNLFLLAKRDRHWLHLNDFSPITFFISHNENFQPLFKLFFGIIFES